MVSHELLSRYGALIVFFNVLASSLGLPFPSITTLMTIAASIAPVMPASRMSTGYGSRSIPAATTYMPTPKKAAVASEM